MPQHIYVQPGGGGCIRYVHIRKAQNRVNLGLKRCIFMSKTHMSLCFYVFRNSPLCVLAFIPQGAVIHITKSLIRFFRPYLPNWLCRSLIQPKELPPLQLASESPNQKPPTSMTGATTLFLSPGPHQLSSQLIVIAIVQGIVMATTILG
jgi:hypothetical protein